MDTSWQLNGWLRRRKKNKMQLLLVDDNTVYKLRGQISSEFFICRGIYQQKEQNISRIENISPE